MYNIKELLGLCPDKEDNILIYCLDEKTNKELQILLGKSREQIRDKLKQKDEYGLIPAGLIYRSGKRGKETLFKTTELAYKKFDNWLQSKEEKEQKAFEILQQRKLINDRTDLIKEFFEDEYSHKIPQKDLIRINFNTIARYNLYLADMVLEQFEDMKYEFVAAFQQLNEDFYNLISFYNIPNSNLIPVNALDYKNFEKLVMIDGMIKSRTERMPQIKRVMYECIHCGQIKHVFQKGKFITTLKDKCNVCQATQWKVSNNVYVTVQRLEVEEFSENLDGVNEPRSVTLELQDDLCKPEFQKHFNPGTRIRYWGTLKPEYILVNNRKKTLMNYYIEVNGFEVLEESLEFTVSESQKKEILKISERPKVLELLTNSYCPEIIGHKKAKLSLLLSAVKGMMEAPNYKRDRIHVLFIGNPGTGKTVMIKKLVEITRLSRFASGLNSSKVGLLAAVIKDEFLGGYKLSAGAIPLANNGICAIDELDKIPDEDKKTLNSAMEEGEIIVDKASIHQKLKANTTIVASCNPKGERFNSEYDRPFEQFNLPSSLLDRFDITFVVNAEDIKNPFKQMVQKKEEEVIEEDLLSKYIIMASYNQPKYNKEELEYLADKCNEVRLEYKDQEYFFGYRQFHSVRNISISFAKLTFSKNVTKKCIDKAIELLKATIISRGYHIIK